MRHQHNPLANPRREPRTTAVQPWRDSVVRGESGGFASRWQRGSVLLYVVWVVVMLALFVVSVSGQALEGLHLGDRLLGQLQAAYLARAAREYAADLIAQDPTDVVDHANDPWAQHPAGCPYRLEGGSFSLLRRGATESGCGLIDEESRINLNTAPGTVLQALLMTVAGLREDEAHSLAAAIQDWRDPDTDEHDAGAEQYYYLSRENAYDCKDGPFENVEELLLVKGMTASIYEQVAPYVTTEGSGQLNLNTASEPALRALGWSAEGVAGFLAYRDGEDSQPQTADDRVVVSVEDLSSELGPYVPNEDLVRLVRLTQDKFLGVASTVFRATVVASAIHPQGEVHVTCLLDRDGHVRAWTEQ